MDTLRDFFNDLALNHIKGVIVSWAILTFISAVSLWFSINYGDIVSAYQTWSSVMFCVWIVDTVFSAIAVVTRLIH